MNISEHGRRLAMTAGFGECISAVVACSGGSKTTETGVGLWKNGRTKRRRQRKLRLMSFRGRAAQARLQQSPDARGTNTPWLARDWPKINTVCGRSWPDDGCSGTTGWRPGRRSRAASPPLQTTVMSTYDSFPLLDLTNGLYGHEPKPVPF